MPKPRRYTDEDRIKLMQRLDQAYGANESTDDSPPPPAQPIQMPTQEISGRPGQVQLPTQEVSAPWQSESEFQRHVHERAEARKFDPLAHEAGRPIEIPQVELVGKTGTETTSPDVVGKNVPSHGWQSERHRDAYKAAEFATNLLTPRSPPPAYENLNRAAGAVGHTLGLTGEDEEKAAALPNGQELLKSGQVKVAPGEVAPRPGAGGTGGGGAGGAAAEEGSGPDPYDEYGRALANLGEAKAQGADDQALYLAKQSAVMQVESERQLRDAQQHQQEFSSAIENLDRQAEALAQRKIDPNHYWASKGTASSILSIIGLALGGWGSVMGRTENMPMRLIEKQIDQDIEAQKADLENARQGLATKKSLLAEQMRVFGDPAAAEQAARAGAWKAADLYAQALVAKNGGAEAKAQMAVLSAEFNAKRQAALDLADERKKKAGGGGGVGPKTEAAYRQYAAEMLRLKIPEQEAALKSMKDALSEAQVAHGEGQVPGLGVVHGKLPVWALSSEGKLNRGAIERGVLSYAHATGRVSPGEVAVVRKAALGSGSIPEIQAWIDEQSAKLEATKQALRASASPEVTNLAVQRGLQPAATDQPPPPQDPAGLRP